MISKIINSKVLILTCKEWWKFQYSAVVVVEENQ